MKNINVELLLLAATGSAIGALIYGFDLLVYVVSTIVTFFLIIKDDE